MAGGRILVAYIATDGGIDALRLAVALAKERDTAIDIVMAMTNHEVTPGLYPRVRGYETIVEQHIAGWLDDARAEVPSDIEVTTRVAVGDSIPQIIIDQATGLSSEIVVVGSQGGGLFRRVTLGSVVNTLLHSCPVPLAIAPRGYNYPGPIQRITVLFGTRPGATDIIAVGLDRAARFGVPLRFVSLNIAGEQPAGSDALEGIERTASAELAHRARSLVDANQATAEVVEAPSIETATSGLSWLPGDVAYVGSSRIAPEGRLFLGTTATQILRYTPVPTIVIPNGYMDNS
ncbi:Universal stress protein family protein [Corynebacterium capitovis DSM 44611]|uniref:universal stress protein n=1 Tax=Corynebacterium capitovis TaxID=131081 RepID=UPI000377D499|nr:universal stress protein [Corynebacterium capitovis]WKD58377.1 Universal stress protein family protein [Corynebacterium capitovis DSM 44611]